MRKVAARYWARVAAIRRPSAGWQAALAARPMPYLYAPR
jgi:hypothetical protein